MGNFLPQEDGRFVIVASNAGSLTHPDWYHNLKAHPRIDVEVGDETLPVLAEELDDAARAELWPQLAAEVPQLDDNQAKVTRQIPVIMLTRDDSAQLANASSAEPSSRPARHHRAS